MKKVLYLSIVLTLLSFAASAQSGERLRRQKLASGIRYGQITRMEAAELHRIHTRTGIARHHALRDGRISPQEKRKLSRLHRHERRQIFIRKHNARHRF